MPPAMPQIATQAMSESEDQDFDELDDDNVDDFHVANRLPPPNAMMYRTLDLHKLIHMGEIDLTPPYQRDVVWPESKQIKLIDSIYHNFYIPPIIFATFEEIVGDTMVTIRRCVDGKQRLTSIQKFIDGLIPYKDPVTKQSFWFIVGEESNRREIPQYWKDDFRSKTITCVEYKDLPRGFERDVFQRVQLGIPLTVAEKLQAISSPWADYVSLVTRMRLTAEKGLADRIGLDITRGRDFQAIAQLVYCCEGIPEQRFPTAAKLEQWLSRTDVPHIALKDDITKVMQAFYHISRTEGLDVGFTSIKNRVAPVEFVFIGVLLYVMKGCSYDDHAQAILDMRQAARAHFKDIRANSDVIKYLWAFVAQIADNYDTGIYVDAEVSKKPARKGKKRARKENSDGEAPIPTTSGSSEVARTPRKRKPRTRES